MRSGLIIVAAALCLEGSFASTAAAACTGDCGGDGVVSVSELVTGVNIALGLAAPDSCRAFDGNGDGTVTIGELVAAVASALGACPPDGGSPTPSATAQIEPTRTPTVGVAGPCGDATTVDTFFASNRGFLTVYPTGGRGGLSTLFSDPAGYRLQILVLSGFNQLILAPGTSSSNILFVGPEDVYEDLEHEVNVLFNANPAQPQIGLVGVLQCDKATRAWTLSIAAAVDRFNNFMNFSTVAPASPSVAAAR